MTQSTKGVFAMIVACTVWGLSPLYYALLRDVPPMEVLSYRSLWSLAFFALILGVQGRLSEVLVALSKPRQVVTIFIAAAMIAGNWFGFIFAISTGQGIEASLGYYIFPLVAVVIGKLVFSERLKAAQWIAVGIAGFGVAVLTAGLGVAPWIALWLAGTFGAYGMIKKQLPLGPVVSVTSEVLLLAPLAIGWIALKGTGVGGGNDVGTHALLALSGPLTASRAHVNGGAGAIPEPDLAIWHRRFGHGRACHPVARHIFSRHMGRFGGLYRVAVASGQACCQGVFQGGDIGHGLNEIA